MVIQKEIDLKALQSVLEGAMDEAIKDCEEVKIDLIAANDILAVIKETYKSEMETKIANTPQEQPKLVTEKEITKRYVDADAFSCFASNNSLVCDKNKCIVYDLCKREVEKFKRLQDEINKYKNRTEEEVKTEVVIDMLGEKRRKKNNEQKNN